MALFFFNFVDESGRNPDEQGLEFESAEVAYLEALAGARDMWPELLAARRDPTRCAFEITDEGGEMLFRVAFSELLDNCRTGLPPAGASTREIMLSLQATHRRASDARSDFTVALGDVRQTLAESASLLFRLRNLNDSMPGR